MTDPRHPSKHFIVGIIILFVGLVLLLDQLGFTEANKIFLFWPVILIYFGVQKLLCSSSMVGRFWGGFMTLLGISFQLEALGVSGIRFGTVWPVFLICAGVLLILRRYESRHAQPYYPPPPGVDVPGPAAPSTKPSAAGSTSPPPGVDVAGPGAAASEPPAARPSPPQSPPQQQAPPEEPPRPQTPPPQPNYPGWDPENWRHRRAWERFERKMNQFSNQINNQWDSRSNWAPNSGQQSNPNWQSRSDWQPDMGWHDSSQPRLDEVNIFWGGRKRIISKNFLGGEIVSIFGGFEIDLTQADFPGNQIEIEIVSIFGGGELRVPTNWEVTVESVGIFGGTGDRTYHPQSVSGAAPSTTPAKRLIIKGVAIFGGLTIKN